MDHKVPYRQEVTGYVWIEAETRDKAVELAQNGEGELEEECIEWTVYGADAEGIQP